MTAGQNYLLKSGNYNSIEDTPNPASYDGVSYTFNSTNKTLVATVTKPIPSHVTWYTNQLLSNLSNYTLSITYALKGAGTTSASLFVSNEKGDGLDNIDLKDTGGSFKTLSLTFSGNSSINNVFTSVSKVQSGSVLEVKNVKLEWGDTPTAWTPAPTI